MLQEHVLDLFDRDILAGADNDVLTSAGDADISSASITARSPVVSHPSVVKYCSVKRRPCT
jgi:hypothetical protein